MGDSFLRGYYIIHDMDNMRVGLAGPHLDAGPQADVNTTANSTAASKSMFSGTILYIIIGVGAVLAILILICICYLCCRKKKDETKAQISAVSNTSSRDLYMNNSAPSPSATPFNPSPFA